MLLNAPRGVSILQYFLPSLSYNLSFKNLCFVVSPAKHGGHVVIITLLASSSSLSHFWFLIDNS